MSVSVVLLSMVFALATAISAARRDVAADNYFSRNSLVRRWPSGASASAHALVYGADAECVRTDEGRATAARLQT